MTGFRLGFALRVTGQGPAASLIRAAVELAVAADELGFDSFWVTQHHFGAAGSPMPSPFILLAAVAERTRHLRLGTSIVAATAENAIRLAEDAAVLDLISGGRIELGLGVATGPETHAAFGLSSASAQTDLERIATKVRGLLLGEPVAEAPAATLTPHSPSLANRMWLATNSGRSLKWSRAVDYGVITAYRPSALSGEDREYLAQYTVRSRGAGVKPRVALLRSIYPASDPAEARRILEPHAAAFAAQTVRGGSPGRGPSIDYFDREDFHWGHPDHVVARLAADPGFPYATELLGGMLSARLTPLEHLEPMRLLAEQVAPALGWRPNC